MAWLLHRIERLDQQSYSEAAGRFADSRLLAPVLKALFRMRYFPRMSEALRPPAGFLSLNDLFARRLVAGARPLSDAPLLCPADGRFGVCGDITDGTLVQAKGRSYSLEALLAGDRDLASELEGGRFATVYLSPRDYHRFHAPCGGRLHRCVYVPGRLLPVNRGAVARVDRLFATNERTLYVMETGLGPVVVVAVGAFLVAGVVVTAAPMPAPPNRREIFAHTFHRPATITKGQELGYFRFGSTVIVLASRHFPSLVDLPAGSVARVGRALSGPGEMPPLPELPVRHDADLARRWPPPASERVPDAAVPADPVASTVAPVAPPRPPEGEPRLPFPPAPHEGRSDGGGGRRKRRRRRHRGGGGPQEPPSGP